jgi:hypothetical protein
VIGDWDGFDPLGELVDDDQHKCVFLEMIWAEALLDRVPIARRATQRVWCVVLMRAREASWQIAGMHHNAGRCSWCRGGLKASRTLIKKP